MYKVGQLFSIRDFEGASYYILSCVDYKDEKARVALINIHTGHRATNPISVEDITSISSKEMRAMDLSTPAILESQLKITLISTI